MTANQCEANQIRPDDNEKANLFGGWYQQHDTFLEAAGRFL